MPRFPSIPVSILGRTLARHASTLGVLYTNKRYFKVAKKYIPAINALEGLYLGETFDKEMRMLVSFVEAGNLPWLHLLWIEEADVKLHVRENPFDPAAAMRVEVTVTTTQKGGGLGVGEIRHRQRICPCAERMEPWDASHNTLRCKLYLHPGITCITGWHSPE